MVLCLKMARMEPHGDGNELNLPDNYVSVNHIQYILGGLVMHKQYVRLLLTLVFVLPVSFSAASAVKGDNIHVRTWNAFANNTLKLHQKLIKGKEVEIETSVGGYSGTPDFFKEEKFSDRETGKLISVVQWERENPEVMHTIEVFVHNKKGHVIRDYVAAYLPTYRNAPTQTLVSFHKYNGKLHAFRSFDASGEIIVERCEGKYKGQEVNLLLDEDEIYAALDGNSKAMEQPDYKACFKGLRKEPGKYLKPQ